MALTDFKATYQNKTILLTGHTGFKGAWLAEWLLALDAKVYGISDEIPSQPSLFEELQHAKRLHGHRFIDIRDTLAFEREAARIQPDVVFHLAAQALVRPSYQSPLKTFETNVMGTLHLLEMIRTQIIQPQATIIVTSDKCYRNDESGRSFEEDDALGGQDPYSASKACTEIATHSYMKSFFTHSKSKIATGRAGNVIGGGDWSTDRLVPDCMRALRAKRAVEIRSPNSVRPWQHVLEPLSGYLSLGKQLLENPQNCHLESFNFGPGPESEKTVGELVETLQELVGIQKTQIAASHHEAGILRLSHQKATRVLQWQPRLNFKQAMQWTVQGYENSAQVREQIQAYSRKL